MFHATEHRLVQLDRIYRTYQDSIDLGISPRARYALTLSLFSFLCAAVGAHIATMFGAHGVMVQLTPKLWACVPLGALAMKKASAGLAARMRR